MLHIDLPTMEQFRELSRTRAAACVSLYVETTPLSQHIDAARIELHNLLKEACRQLAEGQADKAMIAAIQEPILDLNNVQVADLLSQFLKENSLDQ